MKSNNKHKDVILSGESFDDSDFTREITKNLIKDIQEDVMAIGDPFERNPIGRKKISLTGKKVKENMLFNGVEDLYKESNPDIEKDWLLIQQYRIEKNILESIVYAVVPDEEKKTIYFLTSFNNIKQIIIPDTEFFYEEIFKEDYKKASLIEQYRRRYNMACTMIGARVSYIVTKTRKEIMDTGEILYYAEASRKKARENIKDYYFFGSGGTKVKVGDIVYPRILSLNRIWAKVEVLGIETTMHMEMLSSTKWIRDCTKEFRIGQKIDAVVTSIKVNKETRDVKLLLSRKYLATSSVLNTDLKKIKKGTIIMGEVVNYNSDKKVATAILQGEILCSIPQHRVTGINRLYPGDKISAIITEVYAKEGYVIATAKKLLTKYDI